jgi:hypothetical protein
VGAPIGAGLGSGAGLALRAFASLLGGDEKAEAAAKEIWKTLGEKVNKQDNKKALADALGDMNSGIHDRLKEASKGIYASIKGHTDITAMLEEAGKLSVGEKTVDPSVVIGNPYERTKISEQFQDTLNQQLKAGQLQLDASSSDQGAAALLGKLIEKSKKENKQVPFKFTDISEDGSARIIIRDDDNKEFTIKVKNPAIPEQLRKLYSDPVFKAHQKAKDIVNRAKAYSSGNQPGTATFTTGGYNVEVTHLAHGYKVILKNAWSNKEEASIEAKDQKDAEKKLLQVIYAHQQRMNSEMGPKVQQ